MRTRWGRVMIVAVTMAMIIPAGASAADKGRHHRPSEAVEITLLHTNDFHGRLETDYALRGGSAYLADAVNDVRAEVGAGTRFVAASSALTGRRSGATLWLWTWSPAATGSVATPITSPSFTIRSPAARSVRASL